MDEEIDPFISGELLPLVDVVVQVDVGDLDGFEVLNLPADFDILPGDVADIDDAPNAIARKKLWVFSDIFSADGNVGEGEIGKRGFVLVCPIIEKNGDFVNDAVAASLTDFAFHLFGFGTMHVVGADDLLGFLQALLDGLWVIGGAVLAKEIFKDIGRNWKVAPDLEGKILTDYLADE